MDQAANELRCVEFWCASSRAIPEFEAVTRQRALAPGIGLPGRAWRSGKPEWITNLAKDANFPDAPTAIKHGLRAGYCFPIKLGDEILGVVECFSRKVREPEAHLLQTFADIGADLGRFIEREQAEELLRESEARFRNLANSAPVLIWMSGTDKKCTYFNNPWLEFTGRTLQQKLGDGWAEGVHPDDLPRCFETYVKSFDTRQEFEMEYRLRRHDGEYRWLLDHGIPRFASANEFSGYIGSCVEITERKQAETALREAKNELAKTNEWLEQRVRERTIEVTKANAALQMEITAHKEAELELRISEAKFRGFVESAPDATVIVGVDGHIFLVNSQTERLFGYSRTELLGRPLDVLMPGRYQRRQNGQQTNSVADPQAQPMGTVLELLGRRKDGSEFPLEISLSPLQTQEGILVYSSIRDITERKQAESARARLATIVESSSDAILSQTLDGIIISWNKGAEKMLGYTTGEIVGHSVSDLIPSDYRDELGQVLERVRRDEAIEPFETVRVRKDGHLIHVSLTLSPIRDEQGGITSLSAIMQDISERKRLEVEILQISEREQRRVLEDLHDGVGQQLGGIACLCDVLKKNLADQALPEAAAADKIGQLLTAAMAQTRGLARGLHAVPPEANGLMSSMEDLAARVTDQFRISCRFECPEPVLIEDNTTATHLYRIAQEAINNAIKHGRAQCIEIRLFSSPERVSMTVSDDGVGFKNVERDAKGMGLRIMNHRAAMIGGQLVVQKKPAGGTDVVCTVRENSG